MPFLHRKPVPTQPLPESVENGDVDPDAEVWYLPETGEVFLDYESYSDRLNYLLQEIFQCEYSGRKNLHYFDALASEEKESQEVWRRFPEVLFPKVLKSVQFHVIGRLDALVDLVYDRFKDRYFPGEILSLDHRGDKYQVRVTRVYPPQAVRDALAKDRKRLVPKIKFKMGNGNGGGATTTIADRSGGSPLASGSTSNGLRKEAREEVLKKPPTESDEESTLSDVDESIAGAPSPNKSQKSGVGAVGGGGEGEEEDEFKDIIHVIGTDLSLSLAESLKRDDTGGYFYNVQFFDTERESSLEGAFHQTTAEYLNRDRLSFSKSILKRVLKECLWREPLIASPWFVKTRLAKQYGIPMEPPEEIKAKNAEFREGKLAKRKRARETNLESAAQKKKREKVEQREAEKAAKEAAKEAEKEKERLEKLEREKEREREREARKAIKYPIEDLDLDPMTIFDGRILRRTTGELPPLPQKPALQRDLPFPEDIFELFLMTWNLINVFSRPLALSTFTLDDFENALRHNLVEPSCFLLAEIHGTMINLIVAENLRVPGTVASTATGDLPVLAATAAGEGGEMDGMSFEVKDAFVRKGLEWSRGWDRGARLKNSDGREGWEKHLVGCICQRGGLETVPEVPRILRHLFTAGSDDLEPLEPDPNAVPEEEYLTLSFGDKLVLIRFLCELVMGSKAVRGYIEECDLQVTELRKERADINRERRTLLEEKAILEGKTVKPKVEIAEDQEGTDGDGDTSMANGDTTLGGGSDNGDSSMDVDLLTEEKEAKVEEAEVEDDEEEIDELADGSESGSGSGSNGDPGPSSTINARRAALKEKQLRKEAEDAQRAIELAKQRELAQARNAGRRAKENEKKRIEDELNRLVLKDDRCEREFRRCLDVCRTRPLGKDRFGNRYWWFDGVGGMTLIGQGGAAVWGTGRLFLQGPSKEEWEWVCETRGGVNVMEERRRKEEGVEGLLGPGEWAFVTEEEEINALLAWMNVKGIRELALKTQINKWLHHILAGARKRQNEILHGVRPEQTRRSTRKTNVPDVSRLAYMHYVNKLATK